MSNTAVLQNHQVIFLRQEKPLELLQVHGESGQDKGTPGRTYAGSSESQNAMHQAHQRPKHHGPQKRKVREISGCVTPEVFEQVEQLRDVWAKEKGRQERLSRSEVVAALVKIGIQKSIVMQYGSMFEPILEKLMERIYGGNMKETNALLTEIYYTVEQIRITEEKLLYLALRGDTNMLYQELEDTEKAARVNIARQEYSRAG